MVTVEHLSPSLKKVDPEGAAHLNKWGTLSALVAADDEQEARLVCMTAQPQGGYALPLADYSEEVMRQFVFDQGVAADKIGVTPNAIDPAAADAFFAWTRTLTPTDEKSSRPQ